MGRDIEAAFLGDLKTEEFIGRELRVCVLLPELHDVRSSPVALGEPVRNLAERGGCTFVTHQNLRLHAADAGEGGELVDEIAEQVAASASCKDFIPSGEKHSYGLHFG